MANIKLNGFSKIIGVILTLLILTGTILLAVGSKKNQVNTNTLEIGTIKKTHQEFQNKIYQKFEDLAGDLGAIRQALGIVKK